MVFIRIDKNFRNKKRLRRALDVIHERDPEFSLSLSASVDKHVEIELAVLEQKAGIGETRTGKSLPVSQQPQSREPSSHTGSILFKGLSSESLDSHSHDSIYSYPHKHKESSVGAAPRSESVGTRDTPPTCFPIPEPRASPSSSRSRSSAAACPVCSACTCSRRSRDRRREREPAEFTFVDNNELYKRALRRTMTTHSRKKSLEDNEIRTPSGEARRQKRRAARSRLNRIDRVLTLSAPASSSCHSRSSSRSCSSPRRPQSTPPNITHTRSRSHSDNRIASRVLMAPNLRCRVTESNLSTLEFNESVLSRLSLNVADDFEHKHSPSIVSTQSRGNTHRLSTDCSSSSHDRKGSSSASSSARVGLKHSPTLSSGPGSGTIGDVPDTNRALHHSHSAPPVLKENRALSLHDVDELKSVSQCNKKDEESEKSPRNDEDQDSDTLRSNEQSPKTNSMSERTESDKSLQIDGDQEVNMLYNESLRTDCVSQRTEPEVSLREEVDLDRDAA